MLQADTMDPGTRAALERGGLITMTTIGRRSGAPRSVDVGFFHIEGRFYVSGRPGFPRSWMANLRANPRFTVSLHGSDVADLPAHATPITDPTERGRILPTMAHAWGYDLAQMIPGSPLVEVTFPDDKGAR